MLCWKNIFEDHPNQVFWINLDNKCEDKVLVMDQREGYIDFRISLQYIDYFRDKHGISDQTSDITLAEVACQAYYQTIFSQ